MLERKGSLIYIILFVVFLAGKWVGSYPLKGDFDADVKLYTLDVFIEFPESKGEKGVQKYEFPFRDRSGERREQDMREKVKVAELQCRRPWATPRDLGYKKGKSGQERQSEVPSSTVLVGLLSSPSLLSSSALLSSLSLSLSPSSLSGLRFSWRRVCYRHRNTLRWKIVPSSSREI